jgi:hypothetical protein
MALLEIIAVKRVGIADLSTVLSAADTLGDTIPVNDNTIFLLVNGGGSTCNVTIAAQVAAKAIDGFGALPNAALTLAVAAGDNAAIHAPPFSHGANGKAQVTYDQVASVLIGALQASQKI